MTVTGVQPSSSAVAQVVAIAVARVEEGPSAPGARDVPVHQRTLHPLDAISTVQLRILCIR
jgi:hypothetical protein